jgi:hypothetical protein
VTDCGFGYESRDETRSCPRPAVDGRERCPFHLTPAEREAADVGPGALRAAFVDDLEVSDPHRREYVGVSVRDLDLSELVVDGGDVGRIEFRDLSVHGTLDLSGSVWRHPLDVEDAQIGQLDATDAAFEMAVDLTESTLGRTGGPATAMRFSRSTLDRSLRVAAADVMGSLAFPGATIQGWLTFDEVDISGRTHFPRASLATAQFLATQFGDTVEFGGASCDHLTFDGVGLAADARLDLSDGAYDRLRVFPGAAVTCRLEAATVDGGRLEQPDEGEARYDLTAATIGTVDFDCTADTFDRYRLYRTRYDGFEFAAYRPVFRATRWDLHAYRGEPVEPDTVEGLEHTYLEARRGASAMGDDETASKFFVRELRFRRRRYAAHARSADFDVVHRLEAATRWVTNGFLDLIAGYGERPHRPLLLAMVLILTSAIIYPATDGLTTGAGAVTYAGDGLSAVVDGLYFSMVTFATLGLGDVHPVGTIGRFIAASEGLAGAFLTAVFVFSLGRRVAR